MEAPLTRNIRKDGPPPDIEEYMQSGGYGGVRKALLSMTPAQVTSLVAESGLRGRGGAGFPTGAKWGFVPPVERAPYPRYLVANGDEMEPGTFKDRYLMEGDPHQLVEGVILASYAIQADEAFVFIRGEYARAARLVERAVREATEHGYLGEDILGTGFNLEVRVHTSVGRYMCGEETALLNSLEGKRATPRFKPPFPQTVGLFGRPTVVQNVETLCNVPHIVLHGAEYFRSLSLSRDEGGTKVYGVSGRVKHPGIYELPIGTTMRELLEEHAGGMREGYSFRGVLPGGASTDFLVEKHLDTPLDFSSVAAVGSRLGTGTMVVLDDKTCPVGMVHNLERFFAQESCGWCTPCRDGLPWIAKALEALESGVGEQSDIEMLDRLAALIAPGNTFCALAPGAAEPLTSALRYFRDDFERHVRLHRCPWSQVADG